MRIRRISPLETLSIAAAFFSFSESAAFAYIDPGTGSYLFQMLMAGLLGSAFAIKMAWKNIKLYITQLFSRHRKKNDNQE